MTQIFDDEARAIPVTVIKAGPCHVTQIRTNETDGYTAVQISYGEIARKNVNKPTEGHYAKAGVEPARHLVELRVDDVSSYELGQAITVGEVFEAGGKADVSGVSKGKGFQGVMKRHNFSGQGASHGVHKVHRAPGSIGACATRPGSSKARRCRAAWVARRPRFSTSPLSAWIPSAICCSYVARFQDRRAHW